MKSLYHSFSFLFLFIFSSGFSQTPVIIPIESANYALVLQTDKDNRLATSYFGDKLLQASDYAGVLKQYRQNDGNDLLYSSAYTTSGTWNLVEPALRITHADGNVSTDIKYQSHQTQKIDDNVSLTTIRTKDLVYGTEVTLYYKVYAKQNVIEQWSSIKNTEKGSITLHKYASANLYFIASDYYLTHYHGIWAQEMKPEQTKLTHGIKTLDSKLGTRANLLQPPSFMLSFDRPATEDEGKVLLGTLGWSGNFQMDFEVDPNNNLRILAGINPHASEYPLTPGKEFVTPTFIYAYSTHGTGEASRNLHQWARNYRVLDGNGSRLTLLNNWEATYFDFDEQKLSALFKDGKKLGVDVFLLDDGWFGNKYPRNSDQAGLGDWQENRKKLPNRIGYLIKEATNAGIKFGIWVEPEMVNPKSELYEKHPDWVIRQPDRPEYYFRNQLVLDLSNPQVQDFVFGILDNLFTKNPELAFIKWDCNSVMFNAHSVYLQRTKQKQSQLYVDYVKGLYKVLERVRAKYPKVPMMLCSGGGGRVDYEALKYFTEFWLSDNTDPLERVFMQWDYSYFFPAITHCDHITDWSKVGIKYRTDVAMMGKMGYDIVVSHLSENDLKFSQQAVATYKSISDVVWHGDLYRLVNPYENAFASLLFASVDKSRAVVFNYLTTNRYDYTASHTPVKLKGLDPQKRYRIQEINLYPGSKPGVDSEAVYTGDFLMKVGINPNVSKWRTSVILEVTEVK